MSIYGTYIQESYSKESKNPLDKYLNSNSYDSKSYKGFYYVYDIYEDKDLIEQDVKHFEETIKEIKKDVANCIKKDKELSKLSGKLSSAKYYIVCPDDGDFELYVKFSNKVLYFEKFYQKDKINLKGIYDI